MDGAQGPWLWEWQQHPAHWTFRQAASMSWYGYQYKKPMLQNCSCENQHCNIYLQGVTLMGKKKGLKVPGNFGSNTTEPAEDRIRYIFLSSLQKRRMREDFIALYNSLRRDCWHLEKHKDKYCLSLLKTVKPFPLYWRPHHFSVFNWSWNKGFIFGK